MVRLSRATLLVAEQGAEKSALIRSTVMPLLTDARAGGRSEIAILFDAWDTAPLPALQQRIRQAAEPLAPATPAAASSAHTLVSSLREWQERLGVTFFIIFDRFESYLTAPRGRTGYTEFEDELVGVANDPTLRANFLFALEEQAEPLLARLRERIPRLGYSRVRLPRANRPAPEQPRTPRETSVVEMARRLAAEKAAAALPVSKKRVQPARPGATHAAQSDHATPAAAISVVPIATPVGGAPTTKTAEAPPPVEATVAKTPRPAPKKTVDAIPAKTADAPVPHTAAETSTLRKAFEAPAVQKADAPVAHKSAAPVPQKPLDAVIVRAGAESLDFTQSPDTPRASEPAVATSAAASSARDSAGLRSDLPADPNSAGMSRPASSATPAVPHAAADAARPAAPQPVERSDLAAILASASARGDAAPRPRGGWSRWAFAALVIAGLALFLQPRGEHSSDTAGTGDRADAASEGKIAPAPVAGVKDAGPAKAAAAPEPSRVVPPPSPPARTVSPAGETASPTVAARTAQPVRATESEPRAAVLASAPNASDVRARVEPAPPKSAPLAAPKPVPAAPQTQSAAQKSVPAKAPQAVSPVREATPPSPASRAVENSQAKPAAPRPQVDSRVATVAKPSAVAPPAASEAPAGPRLYINVRTESQRAWAEQIARPLADRGIRIAGIRMVTSGPDQPDLRYHNLSERDELLKVAVALREFGLSAQQLRHVEETDTPVPARQYELWLPPTGYDRRP